MIEHIWTVLCSRSLIDHRTNNISLIDIIEELQIVGPPLPQPGGQFVIPINFEVVTLWGRGQNNLPIRGYGRLLFIDPASNTLRSLDYEIDLSVFQRVRTCLGIIGLSVQNQGRYILRVQMRENGNEEWQTVANIPLNILFQSLGQPPIPQTN